MVDMEPTKVYHVCSQEENLAKLNLVLLGNGHPEDGIAFKVLKMQEDLKYIKDNVEEFKEMHQATLDAVTTNIHALDLYKAESAKFEAGKAAERHARGLLVARWFQVITITIALSAAVIGYVKLKNDIDNNKTPIQTTAPVSPTSVIPARTYYYNGENGIF